MTVFEINGRRVFARKIKFRWPDGQWQVFCGSMEATGATLTDALHNFERAHPK